MVRKRDGMELFEAATTAGRTRLRPIVMTTLTTILGLVPMAFEIGEGAELQAPLAPSWSRTFDASPRTCRKTHFHRSTRAG